MQQNGICARCGSIDTRTLHLKLQQIPKNLQIDEKCNWTTEKNARKNISFQTQMLKVFTSASQHCNHITNYIANLERHVKAVHMKIKDIQCKHCVYTTSENGIMVRHMRARHEHEDL